MYYATFPSLQQKLRGFFCLSKDCCENMFALFWKVDSVTTGNLMTVNKIGNDVIFTKHFLRNTQSNKQIHLTSSHSICFKYGYSNLLIVFFDTDDKLITNISSGDGYSLVKRRETKMHPRETHLYWISLEQNNYWKKLLIII